MSSKVLVVDDSALMRKHLRAVLESDPELEVETARDGADALRRVAEFDPDVVTLDINMPVMDGLTCLAELMARAPRPVIMVSSLTEKGALATFEAMALGAVDYVLKPGGTISLSIDEVAEELRAKVHAASRARINRVRGLRERIRKDRPRLEPRGIEASAKPGVGSALPGVIVVGVSTGGPSTLETVLGDIPSAFGWPILVAQHMPGRFTSVFSERLDRRCALHVQEVRGPTPLEPGAVFIGRGDADLVVSRRAGRLVATSVPANDSPWHPSVDRLVQSALELVPASQLIGVQLTGMGYDGAQSMAELKSKGGQTIAESEDSAVIFGMPRELIERGGASEVLAADEIGKTLCAWTGLKWSESCHC
ncbi:MAG: chemotaxis-specific protein-glutamate methyltransferase CheB [Gammaproteobacteria bacterium]|nr:chemotaxis-specific protein-glutamate methyltransferase CheB [Gammaproteobacteria bacterium]